MLVDKLHELLARALLYFFGPRRLIAPISTFTGQCFDPLARNEWELVQDIELADIAQGLSNICRFNGQVSHFHSVAAHSVLVCDMVEGKRNKIFALLHDSSEYVLMLSTVKSRKMNLIDALKEGRNVFASKSAMGGVRP
ncbi:hypothetical protein [Herbaspirillum huttiense]|uniref:hypothetical protein n=1 Tax=Herbaspirillum huttiense TaxID=863372 RepID=UPI0039AFF446